MQACGTRAPFRSAFAGKAFSAKTTLNKSTGYARRNSFKIQAKIDTGYKKTVWSLNVDLPQALLHGQHLL